MASPRELLTRREFLMATATGLGGVALAACAEVAQQVEKTAEATPTVLAIWQYTATKISEKITPTLRPPPSETPLPTETPPPPIKCDISLDQINLQYAAGEVQSLGAPESWPQTQRDGLKVVWDGVQEIARKAADEKFNLKVADVIVVKEGGWVTELRDSSGRVVWVIQKGKDNKPVMAGRPDGNGLIDGYEVINPPDYGEIKIVAQRVDGGFCPYAVAMADGKAGGWWDPVMKTWESGHIENGIRFTEPVEIAPGAFVELGTVASTPETPSLYDKHVKIGSRFAAQLWESLRRSSFPKFTTNEALIDHLQGQGYIADVDIPYPLDTVDFDRRESFKVGWKTLNRVNLSDVKVFICDTPNWDLVPLSTQEDKLVVSHRRDGASLSKDPVTGGLIITLFVPGLTGDEVIDSYYFAPGVISYRGYLVPRETLARLFKALQIRHTVSGGQQDAWAAVTASGYGAYAGIYNSISASSSLLLKGN